ncbi:MAG: T9SS type A sorting domain-containing protein [Flavobacteriales bacterium]|nr:T9SS type A sorting domain-containing protein [Flavobacteriales bacterium]
MNDRRLESYLAIKYGITLSGQNYVNANLTKVWDTRLNNGYNANVLGVGRDTTMTLDQRQSTSSNEAGFLTIGVDTLTRWNHQNPAVIPEGHFLLTGDDGQARAWADREPGQAQTMERRWSIQRTGNQLLNTLVRLDTSTVLNDPEIGTNHWLVIDRSGTGEFGMTSTDYIASTGVELSTGSVLFDGVVWDVDGSGRDVFTFAVGGSFIPTAWIDPPTCDPATTGTLHLGVQGGGPSIRNRLQCMGDGTVREWTSPSGEVRAIEDVVPGEYELRIEDQSGYILTDRLWVEATDAPSLSLRDSYELSAQYPLTLDAGAPGSVMEYRWELDEQLIGDERQLLIEETGNYQCTIVSDGCPARKAFTVTAKPAQGVLDAAVLPNPTSDGWFTVQTVLPTVGDVHLLVIDVMGRVVHRRELHGSDYYRTGIHIQASGQYTVIIRSGDEQRAIKLVVL